MLKVFNNLRNAAKSTYIITKETLRSPIRNCDVTCQMGVNWIFCQHLNTSYLVTVHLVYKNKDSNYIHHFFFQNKHISEVVFQAKIHTFNNREHTHTQARALNHRPSELVWFFPSHCLTLPKKLCVVCLLFNFSLGSFPLFWMHLSSIQTSAPK